jgi:predicted Zn finger-like uncharacterized protein
MIIGQWQGSWYSKDQCQYKRVFMLLTCPHCETIFRVDRTEIKTSHRHVRCSVCRHVWQANGGRVDGVKKADVNRQFKNSKKIAITMILLAVLGALAAVNRNLISIYLPQTIPIYQMAGLAISADAAQVEVLKLSATRKRDTIRVTGMVVNQNPWPVHSPLLMVKVLGNSGQMLAEKAITLDDDIIGGGVAAAFSTQVLLGEVLDDNVLTEIVVVPMARPLY